MRGSSSSPWAWTRQRDQVVTGLGAPALELGGQEVLGLELDLGLGDRLLDGHRAVGQREHGVGPSPEGLVLGPIEPELLGDQRARHG